MSLESSPMALARSLAHSLTHSLTNFTKFGMKILQEISNWSNEKKKTVTKEILDIPVNLQQVIIKDVSVKLLLK